MPVSSSRNIVAPTDLFIVDIATHDERIGSIVTAVDNNNREHRFFNLGRLNVGVADRVERGGVIGSLIRQGETAVGAAKSGVKRAASSVLNRVTEAATSAALLSNPITAPLAVVDGIGNLTGNKSIVDEIREWMEETGFVYRVGIGALALIFIVAAFYLLGRDEIGKVTGR